jgi:hypothetical protein
MVDVEKKDGVHDSFLQQRNTLDTTVLHDEEKQPRPDSNR